MQRIIDRIAGYDRKAADVRQRRAELTLNESQQARQNALDAVAELGRRKPGPLYHQEHPWS